MMLHCTAAVECLLYILLSMGVSVRWGSLCCVSQCLSILASSRQSTQAAVPYMPALIVDTIHTATAKQGGHVAAAPTVYTSST